MACRIYKKGSLRITCIHKGHPSITYDVKSKTFKYTLLSKGGKCSDLRALSTTFPPKETAQTVAGGLSKT